MAERVRVREIDDDEGRRLLRTVRRGTESVVTWRRARMVLGGHLFSTHKDLTTSRDPNYANYAFKKARVEHLYAIADREVIPDEGEPEARSTPA